MSKSGSSITTIIIGDLDCLKREARTPVFVRLERAVRRDGEMIDVTAFLGWFIDSCPESRKIMNNNPDFQFKFR